MDSLAKGRVDIVKTLQPLTLFKTNNFKLPILNI